MSTKKTKLTGFRGSVMGQNRSGSSKEIFPISDWAANIIRSGGGEQNLPSTFSDQPVGQAQEKSLAPEESAVPVNHSVIGTGDLKQRCEHPPLSIPHTDSKSSGFFAWNLFREKKPELMEAIRSISWKSETTEQDDYKNWTDFRVKQKWPWRISSTSDSYSTSFTLCSEPNTQNIIYIYH